MYLQCDERNADLQLSFRARGRFSSDGWLLAGLIVVISAVILALAGITFFLTEHVRVVSLRQNQTKAIYLAQAGVMTALYDFRRGAGVTLGEQTVEAGPAIGSSDDNVFILQPMGSGNAQANVLLLNMRANITFPFPQTPNFCGAQRDRLQNWTVRNVLTPGGSTLVIESFKVKWDPPGAEGILGLALDGTAADWTAPGCVGQPPDVPISLASVPVAQRDLSPGERWETNRIWFTSTTMDSGLTVKNWIDVTFFMSDGSSRRSRWHRTAVSERMADLTMIAVGEVRRGFFPFIVWRRLQTAYRVCGSVFGTACDAEPEERIQPGNLIDYYELTALTP